MGPYLRFDISLCIQNVYWCESCEDKKCLDQNEKVLTNTSIIIETLMASSPLLQTAWLSWRSVERSGTAELSGDFIKFVSIIIIVIFVIIITMTSVITVIITPIIHMISNSK